MNAQGNSQADPLDAVVESILHSYRQGVRSSLADITARHPDLADRLREVLPALLMIEELGSVSEAATVPPAPVHAEADGGDVLGDYRLVREIGRGGMGVVYEAVQESLGRHVALKVLSAAVAERPLFLERFQREARAAARLHHTNIVAVHGVGEHQGSFFYAMQLIQGQTLGAVLQDVRKLRAGTKDDAGPHANPTTAAEQLARSLVHGFDVLEALPQPFAEHTRSAVSALSDSDRSVRLGGQPERRYFQSVARLGLQAAEGLAHAHAHGVLHRDVKPANLMLDTQGVLWITDFGLAKLEDSEDLTHTGDLVGTVRYMAPERFEGRADARSDVYALGVTLYEMLTLRSPFCDSDRAALIGQITQDEVKPPSRLSPLLPRDLETIVVKAMARDPAARYQKSAHLAEDLRRFLENRPIKARRSSPMERLSRWCRRNPAIAALTGAVFVLLLCLCAGSTVAAYRLNQERKALSAAEADSTEKLYQSLVAQAGASRFSRQPGQRFGTLEAVTRAAQLVRERDMPVERLNELRNLAIAALALPDFRTLRSWEGWPAGSQQWDGDDRLNLYARASLSGAISVLRVDTDEEVANLEGWRGQEFWLRFSPGGRFLLAWSIGRLRVWDLGGAASQLILESEQHNFAFHPDSRHLLVGHGDGSVWIHDLSGSEPKRRFLEARQPAADGFWFDPPGKRLAVLRQGKVEIQDANTGKELLSIPESRTVGAVAWHPSGNYLALVCNHHDIHVWDLKRQKLLSVLQGCRSAGISVAFTPDGEKLVSEGWESFLRLWDWRRGREVLRRPGGSNLRFTSDGCLLIFAGGRFEVVRIATGRERLSFVQQSNAGRDVAYWGSALHPEGRLFAIAMSDCMRLFDLKTGEELATLPPNGLVVAFQGKDALLTNGVLGLLRWPFGGTGSGVNPFHLGPPQSLHHGTNFDMACDRKGEVIGQPTGDGAFLVRPGKGISFLGPHADGRFLALSPDGKFATTGNQGGYEGVKVWDAESGQLLKHFAVGGSAGGRFSPDGQWLAVTGSHGKHFVRVGTWEDGPAIEMDEAPVFAPDSSILAVPSPSGAIRLLAVNSGRELARLEDPDQDKGTLMFTPDGTRLVNSTDIGKAIHVWDLRLLRRQLDELGLDWDAPPLPEPEETEETGPGVSLQVEVDYGDIVRRGEAVGHYQQAYAHMKAKREEAAAKELRAALLADPNFAPAQNDLAWFLVTGPAGLRDVKAGLEHAWKAIELDPKNIGFFNTLGVALYRDGQYAEAVTALSKSLEQTKGQFEAFDRFFLAMSRSKQGNHTAAQDEFKRAVRWFGENRAKLSALHVEELERFQKEAEDVLKSRSSSNDR